MLQQRLYIHVHVRVLVLLLSYMYTPARTLIDYRCWRQEHGTIRTTSGRSVSEEVARRYFDVSTSFGSGLGFSSFWRRVVTSLADDVARPGSLLLC